MICFVAFYYNIWEKKVRWGIYIIAQGIFIFFQLFYTLIQKCINPCRFILYRLRCFVTSIASPPSPPTPFSHIYLYTQRRSTSIRRQIYKSLKTWKVITNSRSSSRSEFRLIMSSISNSFSFFSYILIHPSMAPTIFMLSYLSARYILPLWHFKSSDFRARQSRNTLCELEKNKQHATTKQKKRFPKITSRSCEFHLCTNNLSLTNKHLAYYFVFLMVGFAGSFVLVFFPLKY